METASVQVQSQRRHASDSVRYCCEDTSRRKVELYVGLHGT